MNQARNLMLLAIDAFNNKQFADAGTLFTASLSSADAPELVKQLDDQAALDLENANGDGSATAASHHEGRVPLAVIAHDIAQAMAAEEQGDDTSESSSDEDEDDEDEEDGDGESTSADGDADGIDDDEEDDDSDDSDIDEGDVESPEDLDEDGLHDIPPSISSAGEDAPPPKPAKSPKVLIAVSGSRSPVKLRSK